MRPLVWFTTAVLVMSLSACSSDADPEATPAPRPTESGSSDPGSIEPGETEPAVPVADGPEVAISTGDPEVGDLVSYQLPTSSWEASEVNPGSGSFDLPDGTSFTMTGTALELVAGAPITSFQQGTIDRVGPPENPRVEAAPNRTVGGEKGYVVRGEGPQGLFYEFGTFWRGHIVTINFSFPRGGERSEEWVEAVLDSVEWL